MTTRITEPAENTAEAVREDWGPQGEMVKLSAQAQRLRSALGVAEKWLDAAGTSREMWHKAEYTRDQLEEELSRTIWQMEVEYDVSRYQRARRDHGDGTEIDEDTISRVKAGHLSNTLLDIYCTLRVAPEDVFGVGEREASARTRYAMMGALLAGMDAATKADE